MAENLNQPNSITVPICEDPIKWAKDVYGVNLRDYYYASGGDYIPMEMAFVMGIEPHFNDQVTYKLRT